MKMIVKWQYGYYRIYHQQTRVHLGDHDHLMVWTFLKMFKRRNHARKFAAK